jgi:hypothetical protein
MAYGGSYAEVIDYAFRGRPTNSKREAIASLRRRNSRAINRYIDSKTSSR